MKNVINLLIFIRIFILSYNENKFLKRKISFQQENLSSKVNVIFCLFYANKIKI